MKYLHIVWHGIVKVLTWLLVLPILFYQKCITPLYTALMPLSANLL